MNYRGSVSGRSGFTIVELLVVIVVIGILAAITIVSFSGVSSRAVVASVQSDLNNASKTLKLYYTTYSSYPSALDGSYCPSAPIADNTYCLKPSTGNALSYSSVAPTSTFRLSATNGNVSYAINDNTAPAITTTASSSSVGNPCPTGYIPVPGSGTYGTNDFCVMKYEAKNVGGIATSQVSGTPWTSITQASAITTAAAACTGCHLISESEWMTIAQNALSVSSNWSSGVVGSGYIFSGHNDNNPNSALAAAVDSDPYNGTGQSSPSNQKRTLTLTNGEVIWDFAGNVGEWTNATIGPSQQPGLTGESSFANKQWNNSSLIMNGLPANSQPSSTGISGVTWNSSSGVGQLFSNYGDSGTKAYYRGNFWNSSSYGGLLALHLGIPATGESYSSIGFRVCK